MSRRQESNRGDRLTSPRAHYKSNALHNDTLTAKARKWEPPDSEGSQMPPDSEGSPSRRRMAKPVRQFTCHDSRTAHLLLFLVFSAFVVLHRIQITLHHPGLRHHVFK